MNLDFTSLTDEELIKYIDFPLAFSELYSRYKSFVRVRISKFKRSNTTLTSLEDDDFLQEAYLALYLAAKSYKPERGASFRTYASHCMANHLKNVVRNHSNVKNQALNVAVSIDDVSVNISDISPTPEELYESQEDFSAVLNQIHISLSDFEKDVLALYLSGYKRSQMAESLNVPVKSVDNALGRIRKKLKA